MSSSRTTDSIIITAALEWVVELEDQGMDPLSPYPTMSAKLQAFAQWFLESSRGGTGTLSLAVRHLPRS